MTDLSGVQAQRLRPMRFRLDDEVTQSAVDSLLHAARLTPSAGNSQPWRFIIGCRGTLDITDSSHILRAVPPLGHPMQCSS